VGEAAAGLVAVFNGREQGAGEEQESVGVLVRGHGLVDQILRVAADAREVVDTLEHEAVQALDTQVHRLAAHVVEREGLVEQSDERTQGTRGVVVLGLAQQQGAAPFDVAQVHVVAQRGADDALTPSTTSTTSGSGLFQAESERMPTCAPVPTAASTGALVKTSASGPMPTSRYDQTPACDHSVTKAQGVSPHFSSGRATTAASITAGWR
jgi:hypothetical protein